MPLPVGATDIAVEFGPSVHDPEVAGGHVDEDEKFDAGTDEPRPCKMKLPTP